MSAKLYTVELIASIGVVGQNYHRFESNGISKYLELASGQHPVALKCINLLGEHAPPPPSQESSLKCVWCPGIVCDLATPLLEGHVTALHYIQEDT